MPSQNIYEYKKINLLPSLSSANSGIHDQPYLDPYMILYNKINELVVEHNHLAKDLELYKKAFKNCYPQSGMIIDRPIEIQTVEDMKYRPKLTRISGWGFKEIYTEMGKRAGERLERDYEEFKSRNSKYAGKSGISIIDSFRRLFKWLRK